MELGAFLTVIIVHLFAVISPGPDFAMVTRNSLIYSRRTGIFTSVGLGLGIGVHVAYSLLGIGFIISRSVVLFSVIKWIGAAYLIYIGYKSLRAKKSGGPAVETVPAAKEALSDLQAVRIGFLTNVLNPKATLFFLALFTQVIDPATPLWVQLIYGIEMMFATFAWFSLVSLTFSNAFLKHRIARVQQYVERVTGAVLIALGLKLALASKD